MNQYIDGGAGNALVSAVQWLDGTLTGTLATAIASIAVASLGFLLLSGRIDLRRSTRILLGCFIVFGASAIATGIMNMMTGSAIQNPVDRPVLEPTSSIPVQTMPERAYDPYAGAALPSRR